VTTDTTAPGLLHGIFFVWKQLAAANVIGALTQQLGDDVNRLTESLYVDGCVSCSMSICQLKQDIRE
jgi:hypothetical protein